MISFDGLLKPKDASNYGTSKCLKRFINDQNSLRFIFFQLINQFDLNGTGQTRITVDLPLVNRFLLFRAG